MKRIHRLLNNRPERPHAALTPAFTAGLVIVLAAVAMAAWQPAPDPHPQEPVRKQGSAIRVPLGPEGAFTKWLTQDVAYIITDLERMTFQQLATNEEREHFIEQFWLRRDPTPGTPANEFKEEHYRRIAYANQRFTSPAGLPGWKTDMGRIYITYGPPDEIEQHLSGSATIPYPYIDWMYHLIEGIGQNIIVEFADQNHTGDFRMTMDPNSRDASIQLANIWTDTVKRGPMVREVRGLGELGPTGSADIKVAETQVADVKLGQIAAIDFGPRVAVVGGRVARIDPSPVNGTVAVSIQLDAPPPINSQPGQKLDATIDIERLDDVVHVGRPVFGQPNAYGMLFKIEPDGQHAVRVPVLFGKTSVNTIQVLNGLVPGDKIILSDMSAYSRFDRIQLK